MDALIERGARCVTVLDVSRAALQRAQARLGVKGQSVRWIEGDVTDNPGLPPVDMWHDRAVFHFLTESVDRARYVSALQRALSPEGSVVIATFALDGPPKCSGLPVVRYSAETLSQELGAEFEPIESLREEHRTPSGGVQSFSYTRFTRTNVSAQSCVR